MIAHIQISPDKDGRVEKPCPIHRDPESNCYCNYRNSLEISLALRYCRNNYENCTIYRRIIRREPL